MDEWSSTEVNAYLGKVENEAKFELSFFNKEEKKKKQNAKSDWEDDPKPTDYISGVVSVGSSVSVAGIEYNNDVGNDILGAGVDAEGSVLNADLKAKGELSVSKDGVDALVSGKAMVTAAEGKASGTINILGIELKGTIGGYAGGLGVEGKVGIEDNHFVLEGGFAALLGLSGGIEVGFNDEGWSRVWDVISFWD